jgi:hypothetical protein
LGGNRLTAATFDWHLKEQYFLFALLGIFVSQQRQSFRPQSFGDGGIFQFFFSILGFAAATIPSFLVDGFIR